MPLAAFPAPGALIDEASKRKRVSLHADILKERHSPGDGLAQVLPLEEFISADIFLFLHGELSAAQPNFAWRAWSSLYFDRAPMFIKAAEAKRTAERIARALKMKDTAELKQRLEERAPRLMKLWSSGFWHWPIKKEDIERIGTR